MQRMKWLLADVFDNLAIAMPALLFVALIVGAAAGTR